MEKRSSDGHWELLRQFIDVQDDAKIFQNLIPLVSAVIKTQYTAMGDVVEYTPYTYSYIGTTSTTLTQCRLQKVDILNKIELAQ